MLKTGKHRGCKSSLDPNKIDTSLLDEVATLVRAEADFASIPQHSLPTMMGKDQKLYYVLQFQIEITYYSAYTKYELIHNGVNYGPVTAEYV